MEKSYKMQQSTCQAQLANLGRAILVVSNDCVSFIILINEKLFFHANRQLRIEHYSHDVVQL